MGHTNNNDLEDSEQERGRRELATLGPHGFVKDPNDILFGAGQF